MNYIHRFGENNQWGLSVDDGCIQMHPQCNSHPEKTSSWIWEGAWKEIERLGGYDVAIERIKKERDHAMYKNIKERDEAIDLQGCNGTPGIEIKDDNLIDKSCPSVKYQSPIENLTTELVCQTDSLERIIKVLEKRLDPVLSRIVDEGKCEQSPDIIDIMGSASPQYSVLMTIKYRMSKAIDNIHSLCDRMQI